MGNYQNTRLFYHPSLNKASDEVQLSEDESYHACGVLRLKSGDLVSITNGNGLLSKAIITDSEKKILLLKVKEHNTIPPPQTKVHLAISPVKKRSKIEWLIEKCTELGLSEISFINCEHSERTIVNLERVEKVIISAMKQSLNPYKPVVNSPKKMNAFVDNHLNFHGQKFIAHCTTEQEVHLSKLYKSGEDLIICIGPEGGFSENEISLATSKGFVLVNMGDLRLRSETAALFSLAIIHSLNAMNK